MKTHRYRKTNKINGCMLYKHKYLKLPDLGTRTSVGSGHSLWADSCRWWRVSRPGLAHCSCPSSRGCWCQMMLDVSPILSKSRDVGLAPQQITGQGSSWPILSLLVYWVMMLDNCNSSSDLHLICAMHVSDGLMSTQGHCHSSVMCNRPWMAPL